MRKIESNPWWPQLVELKDELSLRELAERFQVTPGAVSAALKRNNITRVPSPPGPRGRRSQDLPPEPGETVPTKRGGPSKRHLIEPFVELLGQRPDHEIAEQAGVSQRTIANYRARLGIPGYRGVKKRGKDRKPRASKIDPFQELLGQVPDRVVAERAGVSLNAVRNYRVKRGIPARGRGRPPAGTVPPPGQAASLPVTAPATPTGNLAWKVVLASGQVVVVAAESLHAAAARADSCGVVVSLERIGRMV